MSILACVLLSVAVQADNITVSDTVSGIWNTDTVFVVDDIFVLTVHLCMLNRVSGYCLTTILQ